MVDNNTKCVVNSEPAEPEPIDIWQRLAAHFERTRPADELARIVAKNPDLTVDGLGVFRWPGEAPEVTAERRRANREQMSSGRSLEQFERARGWLRRFPKLKRPHRRWGSSYGLKHIAEREIGYTTNGAFIAAALAEGFPTARIRGTTNVRIGVGCVGSVWLSDRRVEPINGECFRRALREAGLMVRDGKTAPLVNEP